MKLTYTPYTLMLKHQFTLASSSRRTTPVVISRIELDGFVGYGEASLPPYLGETQDSVIAFLEKVNLSGFDFSHGLAEIIEYINEIEPGNSAAKACLDIALHDLYGQFTGKPWYRMWRLNPEDAPKSSFTIGIDTPEVIRTKIKEADPFGFIKIKLGAGNDKEMIETIKALTDKPIYADVNQGWTDKYYALDMANWCLEHGVVFLEQPMPVAAVDDMAWLKANTQMPLIADESFQHMHDLDSVNGLFDGVNLKLMKCGGMREAYNIMQRCKKYDLKVLLGCMTETSCAISAAAQLAAMANWVDLDGNMLITNDCFKGAQLIDGKVIPLNKPGIGVMPINDSLFKE